METREAATPLLRAAGPRPGGLRRSSTLCRVVGALLAVGILLSTWSGMGNAAGQLGGGCNEDGRGSNSRSSYDRREGLLGEWFRDRVPLRLMSRLRGGAGKKTVMGIDIGSQNTRVSIIKGPGVETCMNEVGQPLTMDGCVKNPHLKCRITVVRPTILTPPHPITQASKRLSPSIVAFEGPNQDSRSINNPMLSSSSKNAIFGAKRFIGQPYDADLVQDELKM
eukprot:552619-Amorphochlora_amoeboformis.AAC.1